MTQAHVLAVCMSSRHGFSKPPALMIRLVAGLGVEGDAHAGSTVKHRSRVARDPSQPNLRQVHLVQAELFEELAGQGFRLAPGDVGENVITRGLDLLALPAGARLRLGETAVVEVTGLRNPCVQLDAFQPGLMRAMLGRDAAGQPVRKCGVMGVVLEGGSVRAGDAITVTLPAAPHRRLAVV
jgi:MOSC domain-containing protein YiiM